MAPPARPTAPRRPTAPPHDAGATRRRSVGRGLVRPAPPAGPPPPRAPFGYAPFPPPAPPPPRPRQPPVARVTAAAALLGLGVAALGDHLDLYDLDLAAVLALLLGIVGIGLIVGAFVGGGRWLLLPALVLGPLAIGAATVGSLNLSAGVGDAEVQPTTMTEIGDGLEHGIGNYTVDLRGLQWPARDELDEARHRLALGDAACSRSRPGRHSRATCRTPASRSPARRCARHDDAVELRERRLRAGVEAARRAPRP